MMTDETPLVTNSWDEVSQSQFRAHLFGTLVQTATDPDEVPRITSYFSDLYRDAQWLETHIDGTKDCEFYFGVGSSGTWTTFDPAEMVSSTSRSMFPRQYKVVVKDTSTSSPKYRITRWWDAQTEAVRAIIHQFNGCRKECRYRPPEVIRPTVVRHWRINKGAQELPFDPERVDWEALAQEME